VSAREKKRERDGGAWATAGEGKAGCRAAGPKGKVVLFLFFLFLFQTFFDINPVQIKFKSKSFKLFTKFYKSFRLHTSNQKLCKAK
jgi:hypothetical protein